MSRGVVVSGGFAELNCGQSAILERTVRRIDLKLSREVVGSDGSAELNRGRSAIWLRTVRRTFHFGYSDCIVSVALNHFIRIRVASAVEDVVFEVIAAPQEQPDQAQEERRENPSKARLTPALSSSPKASPGAHPINFKL